MVRQSGHMVIPVHDVNPIRHTPLITYALIAANVLVFLLTPASATTVTGAAGLAQTCRQQAFYDRYAAIPVELVHNQPLQVVPDGRIARAWPSSSCRN